jgi:predicted RNA-binding Zn ribbon-like protein
MEDEIWLDLLNSDWHDYRGTGKREDRIDNPIWLKQFLESWGIDLSGIPQEQVRASLRSLRTILRRIAEQVTARKKISPEVLKGLNLLFDRAPLTRRLAFQKDQPQLKFISIAGRLDSALGEIANSFAEALVRGDPSRIKICKNKDCLWVFYDRTKNKSRKWCEETTCANLMKVRRFREKHRIKHREFSYKRQ